MKRSVFDIVVVGGLGATWSRYLAAIDGSSTSPGIDSVAELSESHPKHLRASGRNRAT